MFTGIMGGKAKMTLRYAFEIMGILSIWWTGLCPPLIYAYNTGMNFQKWLMEALARANEDDSRTLGSVLTDSLLWVNDRALPHINIREIDDPHSPILYHWLLFVENKW